MRNRGMKTISLIFTKNNWQNYVFCQFTIFYLVCIIITRMKSITQSRIRSKSFQKGKEVHMKQVNVRFHNLEQIRQFINIIDKIDANFDLGSGHRTVDAKSILGVLALDLSGPLRLRYHSNDIDIEKKIEPFVCG